MELQQENRQAALLEYDWTGSQLLLPDHSALGQLRRFLALGRQAFAWLEDIPAYIPVTQAPAARTFREVRAAEA